MLFIGPRALAAAGFSVLLALTTACGGSHPEAKAPETEAAAGTPVGSVAPDPAPPAPDAPLPDPPKSVTADTAGASTDKNGSDIIPPFSTNKDGTPNAASSTGNTPKKSGPAKGQKKKGKPKKKPAAET
jgi:hypothetical protein